MGLPVLKYVDVVIGFALVMILASTVVATLTQLGSALSRGRGKYLHWALGELLTQIDATNLPTATANRLSNVVLRHPLIGKPNWMRTILGPLRGFFSEDLTRLRGTVIKREELIRILLEIAGGASDLAAPLQRAFGFAAGAPDAANALKAIGEEILKLEQSDPNEAAHVRETKAIITGTWANALVAKIDAWWDRSMDRVTQHYAFEAKVATAVIALLVVGWTQLDSIDLLRRLSADETLRAALVQQAEKKQTDIEQAQAKQPTPAPDARPDAGTPSASPPPPASLQEGIALLQKQKEQIEAAVADLNQTNLGITSQFYRAITQAATSLTQPQYELTVGTKIYPLVRGANEGFTALAEKINALDASIHASVTQKQQGGEIRYRLTIESHAPNLNILDLRPASNDASLVERIETFYPWWNLLPHWQGLMLSWILLSLGTPFWYDVMKNLLQLRTSLAKQEEKDRQERQSTQ